MNILKKIFVDMTIATLLVGLLLVPAVNVYGTSHEQNLIDLDRNLLKDPSLEAGSSYWKTTGDGQIVNNENAATGSYCGLLPAGSGNASVYQTVTLEENTDYIFKARVKLTLENQAVTLNIKNSTLSDWPVGIQPILTVNCTKEQENQYQEVELEFNSGLNSFLAVAIIKWIDAQDRFDTNPSYISDAYVDDIYLYRKDMMNENYEIIWADDFNGNSLDTTKWGYELGCIRGVEQQHYTNEKENVYVQNGKLFLQITDRALEDQYQNPRGTRQVIYDSGSIRTHGKQEFLYGRIEIKARLPKGQGVFPAFWTLGADFTLDGKINSNQGHPWPVCGEIDIMELIGKANDTSSSGNQTVWQTIHYGNGADKDNGTYAGNGTHYSLADGTFNDDYHIFGLNWSKGKMEWYVDDQIVRTVDYSSDSLALTTLDRPMYVQLNLAAGGNWPGNAAADLAGQKFEIDYIYYGQTLQQKRDAKEYYDNAAKIEGVKDITIYQGEIPDILEGITSTGDTIIDFSIENEHMFTNIGGNTSVNLVCSGKDDTSVIACLPSGNYNIHYTALYNNDSNKPCTRQSALLTVKKRTLENDLKDNNMELVGYNGDRLSSIELPTGWSWTDPETIISNDTTSYNVQFSKNGFTCEQSIEIKVNESITFEEYIEKLNIAKEYLDKIDLYTVESLENLNNIIKEIEELGDNLSFAQMNQAYDKLIDALDHLIRVEENIPMVDLEPAMKADASEKEEVIIEVADLETEKSDNETVNDDIENNKIDNIVKTEDINQIGLLLTFCFVSACIPYVIHKKKKNRLS